MAGTVAHRMAFKTAWNEGRTALETEARGNAADEVREIWTHVGEALLRATFSCTSTQANLDVRSIATNRESLPCAVRISAMSGELLGSTSMWK